MLKNHIKLAFRNLARNRIYSIINLIGLATGMACCLLIGLWIVDELSYDQFHEHKDRIYRVNTDSDDYGIVTSSSWRLGPLLKDTYPEISEFARVWVHLTSPVKFGEKQFIEQQFYLTDPSFFTLFSFPFVHGSPESALNDLNSLVITEETAERYFGEDNPIGKALFVTAYQSDFIISGVVENVPANSRLQFDMVARVELMGDQRMQSWEYTGSTYVKLSTGASADIVTQKIYDIYRDFVDPEAGSSPLLQSLTKIRLYEQGEPGIVRQVYIFGAIALFILIIAAINFMNLSTARSARRAREVGMRKIIGAGRGKMILFFLGESMLMAFVALILAIAITELTLPAFNTFTGKSLQLSTGLTFTMLAGVIGIALFTGLLAGSYPAIFLSSFKPGHIVRGQVGTGKEGAFFRKSLVIFQFAISIGMIISTTVLYRQVQYIQGKDLGFNRDHIMTVQLPNDPSLAYQYEPMKSTLLNIPGVVGVTASATLPTEVGQFIGINWEGHMEEDPLPVGYTMVDYRFFETFDMDFVLGRPFSQEQELDETEACIINETALERMAVESPLGMEVDFQHPAFEASFRRVRIIGVVKDFHFRSMHEPIGPFVFRVYKPWLAYFFIRLHPEHISETVAEIEDLYDRLTGGYPFEYEFLDATYDRMYRSERQMEQLFNMFGLLAILISCLGLLGLAVYMTERKTKEIGIRKVLGASITGITLLLSKEFVIWVLLANVLAWPFTYFAMRGWLERFVYRIDLHVWMFLVAGCAALIIAVLTVSYQAVKAALVNPVESLRHE